MLARRHFLMLSALLVNTMIATIESLLDALPDSTETIGEITALAERQMRLIILGVPLVSLRYEALLLALAGGVLVLRGLLGSVLLARAS